MVKGVTSPFSKDLLIEGLVSAAKGNEVGLEPDIHTQLIIPPQGVSVTVLIMLKFMLKGLISKKWDN